MLQLTTMPVLTAKEAGDVMHQAPTAEAKNDQPIFHLFAVPRAVINSSAVGSRFCCINRLVNMAMA